MEEAKQHVNPNPITRANIFDRLFFGWLNPILRIGNKSGLKIEDVYNVLEVDSSQYLCDKLERNWERELEKNLKGKRPSLQRALLRTFGLEYCLWCIVIMVEEAIRVIQPLLLGRLMYYFAESSTMPMWEGLLYAAGISIGALVPAVTHHHYFFAMLRAGMWLRIATCSLIYKKCLRLSSGSLTEVTTGKIVNLMSNDVMRFDQSVILLHFILVGPLQGIVVCTILWHYVGWGTVVGFGLLMLFVPVSMILSKIVIRLRSKTAGHTDERVRLMNELLNAMRIVKMYCWEAMFEKTISEARKKEVKRILNTSYARVASTMPFFFSGKLIVYFTFLTYILLGNELSTEVVFVTIGLYNPLRLTMTFFFPVAVQTGSETVVTIRRIQEFLLLEEMDPASVPFHEIQDETPPKITVSNVEASWDMTAEHSLFKELSFEVNPGELLAIIGPVGAGKTSLLMAMLGELPLRSGKINIAGRVAYVSQQPWVFNASVRQNITFGTNFNQEKYSKVIRAASLKQDLDAMPEGDQTLVGDRGVSLSGGQKARINLARALYYDADVYLLDDPLSAVDAKVSNHIFYKCIHGMLRNKPRILVTHQLQYLNSADKILILSEGEKWNFGTYRELTKDGINFVSLFRHFSITGTAVSKTSLLESRVTSLVLQPDSSEIGLIDEVSIPDVVIQEPFAYTKRRKTSSLSQSHGHLNSIRDEHETLLLSSSLDRNNSALMSENASGFVLKRQSFDDSQFDRLGSIVSVASVLSLHHVSEYIAPVRVEEARAGGTVPLGVYMSYFRAGGGIIGFIVFAFLNITAHVAFIFCDWWLAFWCKEIDEHKKRWNSFNESISLNISINDTAAAAVGPETFPKNDLYLFIFTLVTVSVVIFAILRGIHSFHILIMASVKLHDRMLRAILRSPIAFFDNNPIGRILNRFSKDLGSMDELLPYVFSDFMVCLLLVVGVILLVGIIVPWVLIPTLPLTFVFVYLRHYFLKTSRDIKRMEATTKSPVFSHISNTVLGIQNVRAYCAQKIFIKEFDMHQDLHTSTFYMFLVLGRWFAVRLEFISALYITIVCFCCVFAASSLSGSMVGLCLIHSISLMALFQWCVRQSSEVESMMTTVERIMEYAELEAEAPTETDPGVKLPHNWPVAGEIQAENVDLTYVADGPLVLKNLNFKINPGEKIGIVGRTGAGKSSLITLLFRLSEPKGKLTIDGVDIMTIGLNDLRKSISIIPQDPVLLSGTIRRNLDPVGQHSDEEIWQALRRVKLSSMVEEMEAGLDSKIQEGGANISMGQRQLVCLARAILKSNKILIIDEATANVDPSTDALIQRAIRDQFKSCTVLTIAHRLNTIIDSDRVLVLGDGRILELDTPHNLLRRGDNSFFKLAKQTGPEEFANLQDAAAAAAKKNDSEREDDVSVVYL